MTDFQIANIYKRNKVLRFNQQRDLTNAEFVLQCGGTFEQVTQYAPVGWTLPRWKAALRSYLSKMEGVK